MKITKSIPPLARFELYTIKNEEGCWGWKGPKAVTGYGVLMVNGKLMLAHRFSYEIYSGKIPKGKHILHSCDTPSCVNPAHLRPGTDADNAMDKISRGRQTRWEKCPLSKLTWKEVFRIRELYTENKYSQGTLAKMFNVNQSNIFHIVHNNTWKIACA